MMNDEWMNGRRRKKRYHRKARQSILFERQFVREIEKKTRACLKIYGKNGPTLLIKRFPWIARWAACSSLFFSPHFLSLIDFSALMMGKWNNVRSQRKSIRWKNLYDNHKSAVVAMHIYYYIDLLIFWSIHYSDCCECARYKLLTKDQITQWDKEK